MKMKKYHVFHAADGCAEIYLGAVKTLRQASRLAARHQRGATLGVAAAEYGSRQAAGEMNKVPPPVEEPKKWFGRGGWYCACLAKEVA